ncbi:hypothetical protein HanIR_Chr14g0676551 [Helianthus annuus]|nr:hypothetical protein HanIR_Chr14g0676551 [Helianthus annuus]
MIFLQWPKKENVKYRKEKLKFDEKKTSQDRELPRNLFPQVLHEKKIGCMTSLQTGKQSNTPIGIDMSINGWQTINLMNNQIDRGSSMMNISNEGNIAQHIEYTQLPSGSVLGLNLEGDMEIDILQQQMTMFTKNRVFMILDKVLMIKICHLFKGNHPNKSLTS